MARRVLLLDGGAARYGLAAEHVREIVPARALTRLPGAPSWVRGLLNVRGTLLTVIDLTARLEGRAATAPDPSVVIVEAGDRPLGLLVDDVGEVEELPEEGITPAPATSGEAIALVAELGHFGDRIVCLVDVQQLVRLTLA
jgi:purine-binding chemotaxis protein CheW